MDFEQSNESFPPPTLPNFQGTAPRGIKLKSSIGLVNPLPFQGTAPRRIRMKWQRIDKPPVNLVVTSYVKDDMYCVVADSAGFARDLITTMSAVKVNHHHVMVLVVLVLLVVFLAAPLTGFPLRHLY